MLPNLNVYRTLDPLIRRRKGEVKLGERLQFLSETDPDVIYRESPKRSSSSLCWAYPESVGVLANYGSSGTETAWDAFLSRCSPIYKVTAYLEGQEIVYAWVPLNVKRSYRPEPRRTGQWRYSILH